MSCIVSAMGAFAKGEPNFKQSLERLIHQTNALTGEDQTAIYTTLLDKFLVKIFFFFSKRSWLGQVRDTEQNENKKKASILKALVRNYFLKRS